MSAGEPRGRARILTSLRPQQPPSRVTTIYCGAGPIGITRRRT